MHFLVYKCTTLFLFCNAEMAIFANITFKNCYNSYLGADCSYINAEQIQNICNCLNLKFSVLKIFKHDNRIYKMECVVLESEMKIESIIIITFYQPSKLKIS